MKKSIVFLLVLAMALGLVACGSNRSENQNTPTPDSTAILTAIWNAVEEDKKFPVIGGDADHIVDGAPGNYDLTNEGLSASLYVPTEQQKNLDQAASLTHGMMVNFFTAGVFHMAQGKDANAFADAMKESYDNARWICGTPEKLLIAVIDGEYVLAAFGLNDNIAAIEAALGTAYANAQVKYSETIIER